jgi:recombination protein RecR
MINQLIEAFCVLPGVGKKSAQRMTYDLLSRNRQGGKQLADILSTVMKDVGHCQHCRIFSETPECVLCANLGRNRNLLCVVESPADVWAIEQSAVYQGRYFVLMGHLSPLDGLGPEELGFPLLEKQLAGLDELILATNSTIEGEATAHYIAEIAKQHRIKTTRIAHGVPMGGELEYIDGGTLACALDGRKLL